MRGNRPRATINTYSYAPGSYTWTCPRTGLWRFVLWGGAGMGSSGGSSNGASGAYYEAVRWVVSGQQVALVVGTVHQDTVATFPNGEALVAGGGILTTPGVATATGSDIAYNGSAPGNPGLGSGGGTASGGAGAPGNGHYRGGSGGNRPTAPGAGGDGSSNTGASGLALVVPAKI